MYRCCRAHTQLRSLRQLLWCRRAAGLTEAARAVSPPALAAVLFSCCRLHSSVRAMRGGDGTGAEAAICTGSEAAGSWRVRPITLAFSACKRRPLSPAATRTTPPAILSLLPSPAPVSRRRTPAAPATRRSSHPNARRALWTQADRSHGEQGACPRPRRATAGSRGTPTADAARCLTGQAHQQRQPDV